MPIKSKISRNAKQCVTCEYWTGNSVQVYSQQFLEYDSKERAKCNITGFNRTAWQSCNKHNKRHNI